MDELGTELDWRGRVSIANGENTAADAIPGFQDRDADASGVELASCRQPGRARADDDYLGLCRFESFESRAPSSRPEPRAPSPSSCYRLAVISTLPGVVSGRVIRTF